MNCISIPLTDDQLFAVMGESADPEVSDHLEACMYCRARLEHLQRAEDRLMRKLQRADCPKIEMLQDFVLDMLNDDDAALIDAHIATCPDCAADVSEMRVFLAQLDRDEAAATATAAKRTRRNEQAERPLMRPLRRRLYPTNPRPVYAMRGEGGRQQVVTFDNITLILEFLEENGFVLRGQLAGAGLSVWDGALVEIYQTATPAKPPTLALVDGKGRFQATLSGTSPARLAIHAHDQTTLVVEKIDFAP